MNLEFENIIRENAPGLRVALITADIRNTETPDALWERITTVSRRIMDSYVLEMVNKHPAIAATRTAYKACGKDPNRYRPSAEALMRRAVKGLDFYRTTAVVDLINLVSLSTGHSIGAFDGSKIEGDTLSIGVGQEGEPYEAIGRGPLNIAGLPVLRDHIGGIGTPTSDNERTKISADTSRLVVVINCYGNEPSVEDTATMTCELITEYAGATNINVSIHEP